MNTIKFNDLVKNINSDDLYVGLFYNIKLTKEEVLTDFFVVLKEGKEIDLPDNSQKVKFNRITLDSAFDFFLTDSIILIDKDNQLGQIEQEPISKHLKAKVLKK